MTFSDDRALKKAHALVKREKTSEAAHIYTSILGKYPDNTKALAHYNKLRAGIQWTSPPNTSPPTDKIQELSNLLSQGRFNDAILKGTQLLRAFPKATPALVLLGVAYAESQHWDEAIDCFTKAVTFDPCCADAYNNMGSVLHQKKDFESAVNCYMQAVKINPILSEAYVNMGNAQKSKGDVEGAIDSYTRAIKTESRDAEAHINLVLCCMKTASQIGLWRATKQLWR